MSAGKPNRDYQPIIGIEVHVQLLTRSKMFCGCSADYAGTPPNTHTCPVCTGMPGVLPVINKRAVEQVIMTGLSLHCEIAEMAVFARKNYNYPDLPKNYQISMYEWPLCIDGWLDVDADSARRRIRIRRVHLEEDTAKLTHVNAHSLIDFNRSGVPLMEIVSEPDIRTPEEARQYLISLRTILRYLGVSTGDMEKGAMRCEANISLRPVDSTVLGTKVEVKNLNSFRSVKLALGYEIQRQRRILDAGGRIEQVTMGWDESAGRTVVQRSKEYADDYRYFPEPDLPPLVISRGRVEEIRAQLPELPEAKAQRFQDQYTLSEYDARLLAADRAVADYFEATVVAGTDAKEAANWITSELFGLMREANLSIEEVKMRPQGLVELVGLLQEGTINRPTAKEVLAVMFQTGRAAAQVVEERGLARIGDEDQLSHIVAGVLEQNPRPVQQYLDGKETVLRFLVGQVMRATRGKADPQLAAQLLKEQLTAMST
jgi:aspartyl-tRNA(Asn)/glutamyl-tRNA(Gln) amidotransferase subunit B